MLPRSYGETLFDDVWNKALENHIYPTTDMLFGRRDVCGMKADIHEKNDLYNVSVDLPGFQKDDIGINLKNGHLTITATHKEKHNEEKDGRYLRQERFSGAYHRSFYVGDIKSEDVKAHYENGTLQISIPKNTARDEANVKQIGIE